MANILHFNIEANLHNRLYLTAEQELVSLLAILQDFMPSVEEYQRFLHRGNAFSTKHAYGTLMASLDNDLIAPPHLGHQGSLQAKNICLASLQGPPQH